MRFNKLATLLATSLALSAASAQQTRWVEIGGSDEVRGFVDSQSLRRNGAKVKVWVKWVWAQPQETDTVFPKRTWMSSKTFVVYHCLDRTSAGIQTIRYANADVSGDVVETVAVPEAKAPFVELAPETFGESILLYVCKVTAGGKK